MTHDPHAHERALRDLLSRQLAWEDAHVGLERAIETLPRDLRGSVPPGLPWSPWQLLEHLRRAQHDILDFCVNPDYEELEWPADYWPKDPAPPSAHAWDESVRACLDDRAALQSLATDPKVNLYARIPHGTGQTILRELVLAADHAAYHVGELVAARRALGAWPSK